MPATACVTDVRFEIAMDMAIEHTPKVATPAAIHVDIDIDLVDDFAIGVDAVADSCTEDAYWHAAFRSEGYYNPSLDYEDYAPAYCVGYVGFAQYRGSFEDAQKCLWANWERIRGDSRLPLEDAQLAMRAAWDRMALRSEAVVTG